ncbi:DNA glycosylase AlkZ-like family protein [Streptosporangium lutulentum]
MRRPPRPDRRTCPRRGHPRRPRRLPPAEGPHALLLDRCLLEGAAGLVPVQVAGWPDRGATAWADPSALETEPRGRHRTTLLSPFDSLVWDRARTARVFGFNHRLEAYVPKAKRVHGYFTMPVLAGGRLIGRVDPAREGSTLVARQVSLEAASTGARVPSHWPTPSGRPPGGSAVTPSASSGWTPTCRCRCTTLWPADPGPRVRWPGGPPHRAGQVISSIRSRTA